MKFWVQLDFGGQMSRSYVQYTCIQNFRMLHALGVDCISQVGFLFHVIWERTSFCRQHFFLALKNVLKTGRLTS